MHLVLKVFPLKTVHLQPPSHVLACLQTRRTKGRHLGSLYPENFQLPANKCRICFLTFLSYFLFLRIAYHHISSYFSSPYLISINFTSPQSHFNLSYLISPHLSSSQLISFISLHPTTAHLISPQLNSSYCISPICSHLIPSHLTSSYLTSRHLIVSRVSEC
jgi:hypothetical protein